MSTDQTNQAEGAVIIDRSISRVLVGFVADSPVDFLECIHLSGEKNVGL